MVEDIVSSAVKAAAAGNAADLENKLLQVKTTPKRVNFIAIQQEHTLACEGYHQATVCTGYDTVLPQRTTDLFAFTAKKPGVVRQVAAAGIIVDYDDGAAQGFELGRRFGSAAGLTIAHNVVTPLKEGDRFVVGDAICYNDGFFEPDFFDPKRLALKNAMDVNTVLWESAGTHEDSSAISAEVSQRLTSRIAKVKIVVVKFDQSISNLLKPGTAVDADSVLCIIEDAVTANNKLFDERSIETLKTLSAQTPKANVKGTVERIEVFYHGDKEDMSESLVDLCNYGDKELRKRASAIGKNPFAGKVDGGFRIEGESLPLDHVAIRFSITAHADAGIGDNSSEC